MIQASVDAGEIPAGYEPDDVNGFQRISNVADLSALARLALGEIRLSISAGTMNETMIEGAKRFLRNARRSLRAFNRKIPRGLTCSPETAFEAETQVEIVADLKATIETRSRPCKARDDWFLFLADNGADTSRASAY